MADLVLEMLKYDNVVVAILSFFTPVILGLIGWRRLKALGINKYNIAEIADRATFRQNLLDRIRHVEELLGESQTREAQLHRENGEQAAQIEALVDDIRELKVERRALKAEVREMRQLVHVLTQERDAAKAKLP